MKRVSIVLRVVFALACLGWATFLWTRPRPPVRPAGPQDYTSFAVELDGEWIKIRNAGGEVLTGCEIEFTAGLDTPAGATYQGKRRFARWEPGEAQEIGINTSRGRPDVLSLRFTGTASSSDKGQGFWRLSYPTEAGGG